MANHNGKIEDILLDEKIKDNIIDKMMWWEKGDEIKDYLTYKAGIIILKYNSAEEMYEKSESINNLIKIVFE